MTPREKRSEGESKVGQTGSRCPSSSLLSISRVRPCKYASPPAVRRRPIVCKRVCSRGPELFGIRRRSLVAHSPCSMLRREPSRLPLTTEEVEAYEDQRARVRPGRRHIREGRGRRGRSAGGKGDGSEPLRAN